MQAACGPKKFPSFRASFVVPPCAARAARGAAGVSRPAGLRAPVASQVAAAAACAGCLQIADAGIGALAPCAGAEVPMVRPRVPAAGAEVRMVRARACAVRAQVPAVRARVPMVRAWACAVRSWAPCFVRWVPAVGAWVPIVGTRAAGGAGMGRIRLEQAGCDKNGETGSRRRIKSRTI